MIFLFLFLLSLDLLTKLLVKTYLIKPLIIWPGIFDLSLSYNPGIALGIPIPNIVMVWISPVLLATVVFIIAKSCNLKHFLTQTSLTLILAGGFGNLINRLWTGAVIDFLDFSFWPSFNLADSYITIGVLLLIFEASAKVSFYCKL